MVGRSDHPRIKDARLSASVLHAVTFTFVSGGLIPLVVSLLEIIRNNMFAAVTFATVGPWLNPACDNQAACNCTILAFSCLLACTWLVPVPPCSCM